MSRKSFIKLIIIFSIILFGFAVAYFYISSQKAATGEPITLKDFIPFGKIITPTPSPAPVQSPTPAPAPTPTESAIPKLRQLSTFAVAGATAFSEEREKPIAAASLPAGTGLVLEYEKNMKQGDESNDVKDLQQFLNAGGFTVAASGPGSPRNETAHFGPATTKAVVAFQNKYKDDILTPNKLTEGNGIVEEKTRAKIHALKALIPQKENALAVRYVERSTGNVYQKFMDKVEESKISTTLIPKIHEAIFGSNGQSVILRYADDDHKTIETFSGALPKETAGGDSLPEMKGGFFPQNINDLSLSPDGSKIFYISKFGDGVLGTTINLDGGKKSQIFNSAFTEWAPQWVNDRIIALNTKPAASVPGYLYVLDTQTKDFNKVLGGISGLTSLYSPNGKKILYSKTSASGDGIVLSLYDTDTKTSADLGIRTLPEKCVWSEDNVIAYCAVPHSMNPGQYPDIWYQGLVSFRDSIWKINTKTDVFNLLSDISQETGAPMDGTKLFLDEKENYLFFINKKDSILWSLKITQ